MLSLFSALEIVPSVLMANRITWPLLWGLEPPEKVVCENCGQGRQQLDEVPCNNTFLALRNLDAWIILHQGNPWTSAHPMPFCSSAPKNTAYLWHNKTLLSRFSWTYAPPHPTPFRVTFVPTPAIASPLRWFLHDRFFQWLKNKKKFAIKLKNKIRKNP